MATPPRGEPGGGGPDEDLPADAAPASVDALRRLRRWVVVTAAWAVAATAIALVALFTENEPEESASSAAVTELSQRVDELDRRLESANDAQDAEARRVTSRLDELEQSLSSLRAATRESSDELRSLRNQVRDLATRVDDLEAESGGGGGEGGGGGATDGDSP